MIVTFCGHAQFQRTEAYEHKILAILEEKVGKQNADIYLGGYGNFDSFAYDCCKKYKNNHPNVSITLVTPYLTVEYQKKHLDYEKSRYDSIIYPEIEDKPKKYAIIYRNRYMVQKADFLIAYITHNWGGAYKMYQYSKRMKKLVFNIYDEKLQPFK